jgi:hypothetical protein
MRYFSFLPGPESSLACRVVVPPPACQTVARTGSVQALLASKFGTLTGAVVVSPVTVATDKDLTVAAGTAVVASTGHHRHEKADEGWIYTWSGVTLDNRLCESTVWGMASVQTAKSKPTLCLSHQPFPITAITVPCHLFVRQHNVTAVLRISVLETP